MLRLTVISMKSLVSEISLRDIEKLADRSIGEYFAKHGSMDFYQLGLILAQSGPTGERLTECYPQFKSLLVKRSGDSMKPLQAFLCLMRWRSYLDSTRR
jgi:hypothetical protein